MNQNQCVPCWDLDDIGPPPPSQPPPPPPPPSTRVSASRSHPSGSFSTAPDISMVDYEMAELTWVNGQPTMHGLGLPRVPSKPCLGSSGGAWTLESIVNQATQKQQQQHPLATGGGACDDDADLVPYFEPSSVPASAASMTMDALVPTTNSGACAAVACSTRVGSCSAAAARVPVGSEWSGSGSGSKRKRVAEDTCEQLWGLNSNSNSNNKNNYTNNNGLTSTSFGASPEISKTVTIDDHDSVCHSMSQSQREGDDQKEESKEKGATKSTVSTKRIRAAAIHNQSERKRRDKINQRMKTLQKLVPNSSKTDKASMLDEVIDYLKQLQAQVQMMNRMSLPSMMIPMAIQQQLQMSMMNPMGMGMGMGLPGMGMGMGMGMDHMNMSMLNSIARSPNLAGMTTPGVLNPTTNLMPLPSLDAASASGHVTMVPSDPLLAYLACQSQPMTMDTYSKMATMYQQQQQQQQQFGPSANT